MALTNTIGTMRHFRVPGGMIWRQARVNTTYRPGSVCCARVGSEHAEVPLSASPRTDLLTLGCYEGITLFTSSSTDDGTGGALDASGNPQMVAIRPGPVGWFATGSGANQITAVNQDEPCFWLDDNTAVLTDMGGTLSFAGFVDQVRSPDGAVLVRCDENSRVLFELFSAGESNPTGTSDDTVAGVITNLPAGAFVAGVWTATATGAMPTQDVNITAISVGDKFIVPAGTLTTGVVSAANSGVYECTVAGAVGVKAVFTRTARFAQNAFITPKTSIKVGAPIAANGTMGAQWGGTRWSTRPATQGLLVGTGDPQVVPDSVTVAVSLALSTAAITSVPINNSTPVGVACSTPIGGTPQAATIAYGIIAAPTAGGVGAGTVTVDALSAFGTKNTSTDTAHLLVTITQ
jgi:hypothetical protein